MTEVAEKEILLTINHKINAPLRDVYDAWTKPETISKWFAPGDMTVPSADVDLKVGGRYRIEMQEPGGTKHIPIGVYKTIEPNKIIAFTWNWEGADDPDTLVTVTFRKIDTGTEIELRHELFTSKEACDKHTEGWHGCLDNLVNKAFA